MSTRCTKCGQYQDYFDIYDRDRKTCDGPHVWTTNTIYKRNLLGNHCYCKDCGGSSGKCMHKWKKYWCQ